MPNLLKELRQDINQLRKYATKETNERLHKASVTLDKVEAKALNLVGDVKEKLSGKEAKNVAKVLLNANKTSNRVLKSIQALALIKKNIDTFAELATKSDLEDKDKIAKQQRYLKISKMIAQVLKQLNVLKTNLDEMVKLTDSQLTAGIGKSADRLKNINTLLRAVLYLTDQSKVENFKKNPDSYDAAKEWAKHCGSGFNMIGDAIESLPVPNGPFKSIINYFSGVAKTGPKLIDAFIHAIDIKIKKIEESTGTKFFHKGKHRINQNIIDPKDKKSKPMYEGAFLKLFLAKVPVDSIGESLQDLMKEHREILTDFGKTAEFRIDFLEKKIIEKSSITTTHDPIHPDKDVYQKWLTAINNHKSEITKLAKGESSFMGN